ncbi:MAG: transposase, partial [Syntrophomonadaceae bacterium]|nr:transposase [Syntrophomonadaceae bacterium]
MAKLSMKARAEIIERYKTAYKRGGKKAKTKLLDVVCDSTGLSRGRAARLLSGKAKAGGAKVTKEKRGRKRVYDDKFRRTLERLWHIMGFMCGRRMAAGMGDLLDALERAGEMGYDEETKDKLRKVSASTIDRLLSGARKSLQYKGKATTKPGTLLKRDIPIRLGTQWDDA